MNLLLSRIISLILSLLFSFGIQLPIGDASTVYVDGVNGSDDFWGSVVHPVKTVSHALQLVDKNKKTIHILQGTFNETVTVDTDNITIEADRKSNVTITGGDAVNGSWEKFKGHIYRTKVAEKVESVFVGNEQMIIARWPDTKINDLCDMKRAKSESGTNSTKLVDKSLPCTDLTGAQLTIWSGSGWLTFNRVITSYEKGKSISWTEPIRSSTDDNPEGMDCYVPTKNNYYYVSDSLTLLNKPCEWYYDDADSMLYFYAPNGKNPEKSDVTVKALKQGLVINADNVTVKNINVFGCGVVCNGKSCTLDKVNVKCADFFIDSNYFDQSKHRNVILSGENNIWKNSEISDTWGDGVFVNGENNTIENCHIHDVCYAGAYYGGVTDVGRSNSVINCTLHDSGRYNVCHSGAEKIRIVGCDMYNSALLSYDCGSTYTWGTDGKGGEIAYNYIHDNREVAIYLDNNCSNFNVHDNVIIKNGTGITMNSQMLNCMIENNIMLKNEKTSSTYFYEKDGPSMKGSVIKGNTYTGQWNLVDGENAPGFVDNKEVKFACKIKLPERNYGCDFA